MEQIVIDPRELQLEGSANFRDLGGLVTADGDVVRTGLVYRSDALHALTPADLELLAAIRIAMLVDLRSSYEIEKSGPSPLVAAGSRVLNVALIDREGAAPGNVDPEMRLEDLYVRILENGQERFGQIFTALAEESNLPAVIHCAGGKDRTGVTVALLLRLLGVPDEAIVLDYAITDRNMARLMERLALNIDRPAYPDHVLRAAPETMQAFLSALDTSYESADAYLAGGGVTSDHVAALRSQLLAPAS
jgi:protein tyrosine/serine phosphatase